MVVPFAREVEEGMSKVRDLMPMIWGVLVLGWFVVGGKRRRGVLWEGVGRQTLDAKAEGSLAVPNSDVAFARSTSFTFW